MGRGVWWGGVAGGKLGDLLVHLDTGGKACMEVCDVIMT